MRLAFLSNFDMSHEFAQYGKGLVPAHRLLGAAHVEEFGASVARCRWPRLWPKRLHNSVLWRLWQTLWLLVHQRGLTAAVCTTEAPAVPILLARRLRLLRVPVIVMTVAILKPANTQGMRRRVWSAILPQAKVVCAFSSAQVPLISSMFTLPATVVRFVPFGVDVDFYSHARTICSAPDVLSVGTNPGKDFPTLLEALPPGRTCLIVTDAANELVVREHGVPPEVEVQSAVPIERLRDLYVSAKHVVIPLHERPYSSGQTVLLENLVCGRSVIVSDVSGVADYVTDTAAILVPPSDAAALAQVLRADPSIATTQQIRTARERFSIRSLSEALVRMAS